MSDIDRPDWLPDEYDPDAPLVERLPIMADIEGGIEIHVQGKDGVVEVVGQPQMLENNRAYVRLDCGPAPDNWEWEIIAPKGDGHTPRLDRVDPTQSEPAYMASKDIEYLADVDVRIYGVDTDRLQEGDQ